MAENNRRVAIIHGRDLSARDVVVSVVRALGLEPVLFDDAKLTLDSRLFNAEIVMGFLKSVVAAIVVLTPDEEAVLRQGLRGVSDWDWRSSSRVRPNVLIEHGIAVALLEHRVVEVSFGFSHTDIPTDWMGLNPIWYVGSEKLLVDLRVRFSALRLTCQNELNGQKLIEYFSPEPRFDESEPPYKFIINRYRQPRVNMTPLEGEIVRYRELGYKISYRYEAHLEQAASEGWIPYIAKSAVHHAYVWPQYLPDGNSEFKLWLVKRSD